MKIESKFGPGDVVFNADIGSKYTQTDCAECAGSGRLKVEGKSYTIACRDCVGRGYFRRCEAAPRGQKLTIGQVRVHITDSPGTDNQWGGIHSRDGNGVTNYSPIQEREEQYMCIETGIGSGTIYYVEDLFATEQEAIARAEVKLIDWRKRMAEEEERERKSRESYAREFSDETEESVS